jgi:AcrR family transcriptional regulator
VRQPTNSVILLLSQHSLKICWKEDEKMVGIKNNRRTQYTQTSLKQALIQLLQQQPLAKVTVTELCQQADLNRSTFYTHYHDPMALFQAIESDLITAIRPLLAGTEPDLPAILTVLQQQQAATLVICRNLNESTRLQQFLTSIRHETALDYRHWFQTDDPVMLDYYFDFFLGGSLRVITTWLQNGAQQSPIQVATVIMTIMQRLATDQNRHETLFN